MHKLREDPQLLITRAAHSMPVNGYAEILCLFLEYLHPMRLSSLLFLFAPLCTQAQTSVLFIGNSYTAQNDLPNMVRQLALSLGEEMTVASSAPGGYTLFQHASHPATTNAIASQQWDFVVLQEQSQLGALPVELTTTELGAQQLVAAIEQNWECTYPVFYMTWGRANGDPQNCANFPFMCTYNGMQQALRENYVALAEGNDAYTAPVGAAWKQVRDQHPAIDLYVADGSHPTVAGTYLAACVFYCTLFQESCVDATFNASLDPATAAILRNIATSTVLDTPTTWNLDVPNGTDAFLDGFELGPNYLTLIHHGQGEHLWTCSNGQSFTGGTVTFTFVTSGLYTVVHTYNDPCGNTATANLTFDITVSVGVPDLGSQVAYTVVSGAPGTVEVHGMEAGGTLTLFDLQGRMQVQERVASTRERIVCPAGVYGWILDDRQGTVVKGKVVVE